MSRHVRHGESAGDGFDLLVTPESAGWGFSGLRVLTLAPGAARTIATGEDEVIVLPLEGSCTVTVDGEAFAVEGRAGIFAAVTDFVYAPRDATVEIASERGGRFALPSARAANRLPARHVAAEETEVELRGAGQASRQINNFCGPDVAIADRLIAVEVLTPAGNWSSYPPHKHDEDIPARRPRSRRSTTSRSRRRPPATPASPTSACTGRAPAGRSTSRPRSARAT